MSKKKKKDNVLKTKVKELNFIRFSELQKKYLNEVRVRTVNEFNAAVDTVCKDLGIIEKLKQAPPGMYQLRLSDLSGLDILPPPPDPPKDPPTDPPKGDEPSPSQGGKDN